MKNIIEKAWKGDFLVNHERKTSLKEVEFKKGEQFKVRLIRKLKSEKGAGIVEIVVLLALIICFVTLMIYWHNKREQMESEINTEYLKPTAGITYYMARLQYHSLSNAEPDYEVIENIIQSVSAPEIEEEPEPELSPDECLERLFGYIPDGYDLGILYAVTQCECGYLEPDEGVMAVVYVIANRCRSEKFPNTIAEVITQPGQFETWSNGAIQNTVSVDDYFIEVIDDVISEDPYPEYRELLFFTSGHYNPYCEPMFSIGHHYFGR